MGEFIVIFRDVIKFFMEKSETLYARTLGVSGGIVFILIFINLASHWFFNILGGVSGMSFQSSQRAKEDKARARGEGKKK